MVNPAQIVAIKKAIKEGKCKNPYAAINKVRKMEKQYIECHGGAQMELQIPEWR